MKVYSIGREAGCDIVINDSTDVISRRHAILNVMPSGKMTIVDQSHNGTYVNGIRISPNVPVPVTRKDNISFAHVARLDWNLVPKGNAFMRYGLIGVVAVLIVVGCVFGFRAIGDGGGSEVNAAVADSLKPKTEEQIKKELQDSLKRAEEKQDSIKKAKRDSTRKAEAKKAPAKPAPKAEKKEDNKPAEPKKEEPKTKRLR